MKKLLVILIGLFVIVGLSGCAVNITNAQKDQIRKKQIPVVVTVESYDEVDKDSVDKYNEEFYAQKEFPTPIIFRKKNDSKLAEHCKKTLEASLVENGFIILSDASAASDPNRVIQLKVKVAYQPAGVPFTDGRNVVGNGYLVIFFDAYHGDKLVRARGFGTATGLAETDVGDADSTVLPLVVIDIVRFFAL